MPTKNNINKIKNLTKSYVLGLQKSKGLERQAVENGDYNFSSVVRRNRGRGDNTIVEGGMRRNRIGHEEETQDSDSEDTIYNPVSISIPNRELNMLFRPPAPVGRAPTIPIPLAPVGRAPTIPRRNIPPAPEGKAPNAPKFGKMEKKYRKIIKSKTGRGYYKQ